MANEYLKRKPTSSGNSRRWTISFWMKNSDPTQGYTAIMGAGKVSPSNVYNEIFYNGSQTGLNLDNSSDPENYNITANPLLRDPSAWMHVVVSFTDQGDNANTRIKFYINGAFVDHNTGTALDVSETSFFNDKDYIHYIGSRAQQSYGGTTFDAQYFDVFLVDGQTLTADVFGFYKDGKGYQSSGSSDSTDFGPGQWSPHSPRKIKSEIERKGGFGVNGFYLPMNSSNNFGADFHTTSNTILKLKENLPQPKSEIDGGGNYTGALRDDPFKDNLVLAIPGVINGLGNGFGDYSAEIRGSGNNKVLTSSGNFAMATFPSYYGSGMRFSGSGVSSADGGVVTAPAQEDFKLGTGDLTLEGWIFAHTSSQDAGVFGIGSGGQEPFLSWTNGELRFRHSGGTALLAPFTVAAEQWHHVVLERYNGKISLIINGVVAKTGTDNHDFSQGDFIIGSWSTSKSYGFDGDIQDVRLYKGIAKYKGGFDVNKPYTPVGIESWRQVPDTCKNNFCTLNSLDTNQLVPTNGNLSIDQSSGGWHSALGTHYARSGKWYAEMRIDRLGWIFFGVEQTWLETRTRHVGGQTGAKGAGLVYNTGNRGDITYNGTNNAYTGGDATAATGDIISIALDLDGNNVKFYKNNILQYDLSNILESGADYAFGVSPYSNVAATVNFGQNPTFSGQVTAGTNADDSGKGLFKYAPPSGFLALCEDNLPTPAIADPGKHFKCVLYDGTGGVRNISNVGFKPDLVWLKCRSHSKWHALVDSVRGNLKTLHSNSANAEGNETHVIGFNENGFTVDDIDSGTANENGFDYVAWCWKAGGPAVENTDGSITSQVSVNQTAGFSIVSYTGNYTAGATIGHGLGKKPSFMIVKERTGASGWFVYHKDLGATKFLSLHDVTAAGTETGNTACWYATEPNTSVFTVGQNGATNENNRPIIAYCWTEIEGYSKFGSYIANGNADGAFIYCGFKPAWLMIKPYGSGNGCYSGGYTSWSIYDSSRSPVNNSTMHERVLYANRAYEEGKRGQGSASGAFQNLDLLSNGFKLRGNSNCEVNTSSIDGFIFVAFAESPFQTANAK